MTDIAVKVTYCIKTQPGADHYCYKCNNRAMQELESLLKVHKEYFVEDNNAIERAVLHHSG